MIYFVVISCCMFGCNVFLLIFVLNRIKSLEYFVERNCIPKTNKSEPVNPNPVKVVTKRQYKKRRGLLSKKMMDQINAKGLKIVFLAERFGYDSTTLGNYLRRRHKATKTDSKIYELAKYIGLNESEVFS